VQISRWAPSPVPHRDHDRRRSTHVATFCQPHIPRNGPWPISELRRIVGANVGKSSCSTIYMRPTIKYRQHRPRIAKTARAAAWIHPMLAAISGAY